MAHNPRMRRFLIFCLVAVALSPVSAPPPAARPTLFDRLPGTWVLRGTGGTRQPFARVTLTKTKP